VLCGEQWWGPLPAGRSGPAWGPAAGSSSTAAGSSCRTSASLQTATNSLTLQSIWANK
jgi:hypothetical protein